ncbi:MAG: HD domain-containing protein [Patescibacteria group bacterium]
MNEDLLRTISMRQNNEGDKTLLSPEDSKYKQAELMPAVEAQLEKMQKHPVVQKIEEILKDPKIQALKYHNRDHTIDVVKEAILMALYANELVAKGEMDASEEFTEKDLEMLALAAYAHDIGFLVDATKQLDKNKTGHEEVGAQLFLFQLAEGSNLTRQEVMVISEAIKATEVKFDTSRGCLLQTQDPKNKIARVLMDADVANFGREDRSDCTMRYAKELGISDEKMSVFKQSTLSMMRNHSWQSVAGRELRESQKRLNIIALQSDIQSA